MSIKIEQKLFEVLPTGQYPAKISNIEFVTGQYGDQVKFTFDLPPNSDGSKRLIWGWASAKFCPKSKLYDWTVSILGGNPIDRNYNFNSDDLIGKMVVLVVVVKTSEKGEVNKIDAVLPYKEDPPATLPAAPANW